MPADIVKRAIEQARGRDPSIKVAALLAGSRVLAALNSEAAKAAFAEGAACIDLLPDLDERDRDVLLKEAVRAGSTVDPVASLALFRRLPLDDPQGVRESLAPILVEPLVRHGEVENAIELLRDPACTPHAATSLFMTVEEGGIRRQILTAVRESWMARRRQPAGWRRRFEDFYRFFSQIWEKLDPAEAGEWLDEVLSAIESEPETEINARYDGRVEFHSMRAASLFGILNVIQALRPERVHALVHANPELASAVEMYPLGIASTAAPPRPATPGLSVGGGSFSGSTGTAASLASMMAAQRGDPAAVEQMLTEAHRLYLEDTNAGLPNLAPRVFWPSCGAYKVAMYWAGRQSGMDAQALLDQIPDRDFQILASIELAGAIAGLSHQGSTRSRRHKPRPAA